MGLLKDTLFVEGVGFSSDVVVKGGETYFSQQEVSDQLFAYADHTTHGNFSNSPHVSFENYILRRHLGKSALRPLSYVW